MQIAGAGLSVINFLERRFRERSELQLSFELVTTEQMNAGLTSTVGLYLFRVDVDPNRRHHPIPRTSAEILRGEKRDALSLELRYLLTVWATNAHTEQLVLAECMAILDEHAIFKGDMLDTTYPMPAGKGLRVGIDSMTTEDLLRVWDSFESSYRLSVPYVVRTVQVAPVTHRDRPPVVSTTNVFVPDVPPPEARR